MKILVVNSGSSNIKCSIFAFSNYPNSFERPLWETKVDLNTPLDTFLSGKNIDCIGHRIVHGGEKYQETVLIDSKVKKEIRTLADLAPLHNFADLEGIEILEKLYPNTPQYAVFDTAFHRTLPKAASIYAGPYAWFEMGIKRYGFHGISYQYCTKRVTEILGKTPDKMVICHLGSGASLCAIKDGKSIDTTMGFTPLEGLMMDTRCGTVDPGILLYLLKKKSYTPDQLKHELYEKSGLLGISGLSSNMRDILKDVETNHQAGLALAIYLHRLTTMIGSMIASLQGLDTLVFTGGIGENIPLIREEICHRLSFLSIKLWEKNSSGEGLISSPLSKVHVLLIHNQEAFEIARECWNLSLNLK